MKKSDALTPLPKMVVTEIRPEPMPLGTVVERDVEVAVLRIAGPILNRVAFLLGVVSKLVPVIVTAAPGVPMVGVKLVIVGIPLLAVTVKAVLLAADPPGPVTAINPVTAPPGTVATILV
jgi:hypothetical protein